MGTIAFFVALLLAPLAGDGVRLTITGPAVPFESVRYEVETRRGDIVAGVTREQVGGFGHGGEVGLLAPEELASLLEGLREDGAFELGPEVGSAGRSTWTLELRQKDQTKTVVIHDLPTCPDLRAHRIVERVKRAVYEAAGDVPFRDGLLLPEEAGRLQVISTPPARVLIEGVAVDAKTPMPSLPLPPGVYRVRLVPLGLDGLVGEYVVTLKQGQTTSLVVELR